MLNLFELFVKIGVDDQASDKLSNLSSKLGNGLKTAAKIGTAAVGAAAAGITALTTAAVNNYAEYEQLVGGVQTLFSKSKSASEDFADSIRNDAEAVKEFQKAHGLVVDGILGPQTMAEIEKQYGQLEDVVTSSADVVIKNASEAFRTAGLSSNQYMETVTSFSASLLQSLGGDTEKAAEYADMAIIDMADNANKMGTSMEMIQNAYQGFAKQNYTMLDNLKLGYGGTKEEMARLIKDASKLDKSIKANDMSFGNIVKAINAVQNEMGITGTTALEAGRTISGSVGAMKSAWTNLITGLADGNADIGKLIDNLVTTIVGDGTEANLGVIGNILPAIERALGGAVKLIEGAAPKIIGILPGLVENILPSLTSAATSMVNSFVGVLPSLIGTISTTLANETDNFVQSFLDLGLTLGEAIAENAPVIIGAFSQILESAISWIGEYSSVFGEVAVKIIDALVTGIVSNLPSLIESALITIEYFADGIVTSLPTLIPAIMDVIMKIVHILTDPSNLTSLLNAALVIITELAYGLMDAIPQLVQAALMIIENLCMFLLDPKNLATLLKMAFDIIVGIGTGLINAIPELLKSVTRIITGIIALFKDADWGKIGKDLVDGFKNGISKAWTSLKKWFKNLFGDLIGIAKKILGIASPSKVFKKIGGFTAEGFGVGFEDEFAHVKDDMEDALNFDDASVGINASIRKVGAGAAGMACGGVSYGDINIYVNGDKYHDENALAEALAMKLQGMTDRRAAVFGNA